MEANIPTSSSAQPDAGPVLLAVVEVPKELRVVCCNPGCGHSVYRAVHVVKDQGELLVLGSTCFDRRYGQGALGSPRYGGGQWRLLTPEEREMLAVNTAALIARFEQEHQKMSALNLARCQGATSSFRQPPSLGPCAPGGLFRRTLSSDQPAMRPRKNDSPWDWRRPLTEMTGFLLKDGSGWVRVVHNDMHHRLMPWPTFLGWDQVLPRDVASPDLELGGYFLTDLVGAVQFVRKLQVRDVRTMKWAEVEALLAR